MDVGRRDVQDDVHGMESAAPRARVAFMPPPDGAAAAAGRVPDEFVPSRLGAELLGLLALGVVVFALPLVFGTRLIPVLALAGIWGSAAIGLGVVLGRAGQISLGHGALVAAGAYAAGLASTSLGWGAAAALVASVLAGFLIALGTSPILRLPGLYFTLATLVLALMVGPLITAQREVTGGAAGLTGIEVLSVGSIEVRSELAFFVLSWSVALLVAAGTAVLLRGEFGRALDAAANDEATARALGVLVDRSRILAWLLSGSLAGLAGGLYAFFNRFLAPDQFNLHPAIILVAAVIVGGARTPAGPLLGLLLLLVVPVLLDFPATVTALTAPVLLVVFAAVLPRGIAPQVTLAAQRLRKGMGG